MSKHWKQCDDIAMKMGLSKTDVYNAFPQWKAAGLIMGLIEGDSMSIEDAKKFDWYGKTKLKCEDKPEFAPPLRLEKPKIMRLDIAQVVEKKFEERSDMNDFELALSDVKIMSWALAQIGSFDRADNALRKLKS